MVEVIEREKFMGEDFCLYEKLDKVMKNCFGKKVSCSKIITEKMKGVVYSLVYSENNLEDLVCMVKINNIDANEIYHLLLTIGKDDIVMVNNKIEGEMSKRKARTMVHELLEFKKIEHLKSAKNSAKKHAEFVCPEQAQKSNENSLSL